MSREEWWFDFVEDEVDPETRKQMKHLLKHSRKDQELVKSIADTKTLLQQTEEPLPKVTKRSLDDLHDRIMAGIEETEIKKAKPRVRLQPEQRRLVKSASLSLLVLVSALSVYRYFSNKSLNTEWDVSQQMALQGQEKPEDLGLMMSYQNEHDFFVDVASLSLDHLTKEQFESLLNSDRTR